MPLPPDTPHRELVVPPHCAGWRLDRFLAARFASWSRTAVQAAIRAGQVHSDQRPLKAATHLQGGEVLRITTPGIAPEGPPPPLPDIVHEDDRLLILNKPPGLLVHPAGDRYAWAVIGLAKAARPGVPVDLCHRLDRDTSGVLVLAKDLAANAFVKRHLKEREEALQKTYLALVRGEPDWAQIEVRAPIDAHPSSRVNLRRGVVDGGKAAWTTFTRLQVGHGHGLVRCDLHTGRTHQIRVHLEHAGHPLLGDKLYGQPDEVFIEWLDHGATPAVRAAVRFPRHCLHAWRMRLPHPDGGELQLEAPLPADIAAVLGGQAPDWPEGVGGGPEADDEG